MPGKYDPEHYFDEGWDAAFRGLNEYHCPYRLGTSEYVSWIEGFRAWRPLTEAQKNRPDYW